MIGKIPELARIHAGKLIGALLGLVSGLGIIGVLMGFVFGFMADAVRSEYQTQKELVNYYLSPGTAASALQPETRKAGFIFLAAHIIWSCEESVSPIMRTEGTEWAASYCDVSLRRKHIFTGALGRLTREGEPDIPGLSEDFGRLMSLEERLRFLGSLLEQIRFSMTEKRVALFREIAVSMGISEELLRELTRKHGRAKAEDYQLLDVDTETPTEEIKAVYRKLASHFHPDGGSGLTAEQKTASQEAFLRITEAYKRIIADREFRRPPPV